MQTTFKDILHTDVYSPKILHLPKLLCLCISRISPMKNWFSNSYDERPYRLRSARINFWQKTR